MAWWKRFFADEAEAAAGDLDLRREAQSLRLELAERDARIAALEKEVERARSLSDERLDGRVESRVERWLETAAAPASQLLTQAHLVEAENKAVQARDVLVVARQLLSALEDAGLVFEGEVGQEVDFDPDRHRPLGAEDLRRGDRALIRFVAVRRGEKVLCKAGVGKSGAKSGGGD